MHEDTEKRGLEQEVAALGKSYGLPGAGHHRGHRAVFLPQGALVEAPGGSTMWKHQVAAPGGSTTRQHHAAAPCSRPQKEITALAPSTRKIKSIAPLSTSTLARGLHPGLASSFQQVWSSEQEQEESGPSIAHCRCF